MEKRVIMFGQSGQIGSALVDILNRKKIHWQGLPWATVEPLLLKNQLQLIELLPQFSENVCYTLIFANGVTNPHENPDQLRLSNVMFPQVLWSLVRNNPNIRLLTIGTVHEKFPELCSQNSYLSSKVELSNWVANTAQDSTNEGRFLHVRLHTLYGRKLKSHMFLGQIADALMQNRKFEMSSGQQLREYHHVDDIALGICNLLDKAWTFGPLVEFNSGHAIRLIDLATAIFCDWGKIDLLLIGTRPKPSNENVDFKFAASPNWLFPGTRESVNGILQFLREQLKDDLKT